MVFATLRVTSLQKRTRLQMEVSNAYRLRKCKTSFHVRNLKHSKNVAFFGNAEVPRECRDDHLQHQISGTVEWTSRRVAPRRRRGV